MSDSLVSYNYNDPTSSYHLTFKVINDNKNSDSSDEDVVEDNDDNTNKDNDNNDDDDDSASTITVDTSTSSSSSSSISSSIISTTDDDINDNIYNKNKRNNKVSKKNILNVPIELLRNKLSSSAVITTSKNIYKFNKLELAKSEKDRESMKKHITFSKIASDIDKISQRQIDDNPRNTCSSVKENHLLSTIEPNLLKMRFENEL